MDFLFLHHKLIIGGIETLMARMARWLCDQGHNVVVVVGELGPGASLFHNSKSLVELGHDFERLKTASPERAASLLRQHDLLRRVDVIVAFSGSALCAGLGIKSAMNPPAVVCAGVWTPGTYCARGIRGMLADPSGVFFRNLLLPSCRLFPSSSIQAQVESAVGRKVPGVVWPLAVDGTRFRCVVRRPIHGLIVSVGRLGDMKTYNLWMPQVVKELKQRGLRVQWHVYGDGPDRKRIEELVSAAGVGQQVRLMGTLDYSRFPEVLASAFAFVGMGTSLIEASFAGVPGIPAIIYSRQPQTYGYFSDLPDYACGDVLDRSMFPVADLLERLLTMTPEQYADAARSTRRHATRFEMDPLMRDFFEMVTRMPHSTGSWWPVWLCRMSRMSIRLYNSDVLRPIRKQLSRQSR
ncbi:MAG TPA: glycosyltransferase family 4 protein [Verrucomicrobiae bacterium]